MNRLIQSPPEKPNKSSQKVFAEINIKIVVTLQQSNINMQITITTEIPFNIFIQGIKEQIFAHRMQSQYEDDIEYLLDNLRNIFGNDTRNLQELGFYNNCTLYVRLRLRVFKTQNITIRIEIKIEKNFGGAQLKRNQNFEISIHGETPFCFLVFVIHEQLFHENIDKQSLKTLQYILDNNKKIEPNNQFALNKLGFQTNNKLTISNQLNIDVVVYFGEKVLEFPAQVDPLISFEQLVQIIKDQIIQKRGSNDFLNHIYFLLNSNIQIQQNEKKNLLQLGFESKSTLQVQWFIVGDLQIT